MTELLQHVRLIPGAPYRTGDLLEIENEQREWVEVRVHSVDYDMNAPFGCRWQMLVGTTDVLGPFHEIHVNDNGCNYTITRRVRPSQRVED